MCLTVKMLTHQRKNFIQNEELTYLWSRPRVPVPVVILFLHFWLISITSGCIPVCPAQSVRRLTQHQCLGSVHLCARSRNDAFHSFQHKQFQSDFCREGFQVCWKCLKALPGKGLLLLIVSCLQPWITSSRWKTHIVVPQSLIVWFDLEIDYKSASICFCLVICVKRPHLYYSTHSLYTFGANWIFLNDLGMTEIVATNCKGIAHSHLKRQG